ncbi:MAG: M20 family metallopeptidase [Myxococcota bacterium]
MTLEELKRRACDTVDQLRDPLLEISHQIHAHPELAFEEHRAQALLVKTLRDAGLEVTAPAFGLETAFVAEFGDARGPRVALAAEYDALPGIGHACGHNIIATASVGAALALQALGSDLPGRIRLLGTPAEERGGGKERMARAGALDEVDAAMMVHPAGIDLVSMPCLAIAEVDVTYSGVAAHASAMPQRGINALDGLVTAYQSIAQLRQHIQPSERIHGIITDGGQAPNIVPEHAAGTFYVRARNAAELEPLKERVTGCLRAGAEASGAKLEIHWGEADYLDLRTSWPLARRYRRNAEALGRSFFPWDKLPASVAGSTDMGNFSYRVPSIHPMISAAPAHCTIHHPEFARWAGSQMGDAAALDGAKALAMTSLDFFVDGALRDEVREHFESAAEDAEQEI